jgi:hypothetical protein
MRRSPPVVPKSRAQFALLMTVGIVACCMGAWAEYTAFAGAPKEHPLNANEAALGIALLICGFTLIPLTWRARREGML